MEWWERNCKVGRRCFQLKNIMWNESFEVSYCLKFAGMRGSYDLRHQKRLDNGVPSLNLGSNLRIIFHVVITWVSKFESKEGVKDGKVQKCEAGWETKNIMHCKAVCE